MGVGGVKKDKTSVGCSLQRSQGLGQAEHRNLKLGQNCWQMLNGFRASAGHGRLVTVA